VTVKRPTVAFCVRGPRRFAQLLRGPERDPTISRSSSNH